MRKVIALCFVAIVMLSIPFTLFAAKEVKVEVLYMNHGPLQSSLEQIKQVFSMYSNKINVSWYDFETKEGEQFMAKKGINQHIPLIIWLDGKFAIPVNGKEIKFIGFPTGSGPAFFQGKWTMEDLRQALNQITNKPR
jgi:TRAP-type mannitol/chloroaromatic compound transport system permease small subunit